MDEPVLWVLQRGSDIAVELRDGEGWSKVDLPNGAWGLELVRPDGAAVRIWDRAGAPPRVEQRWIDLSEIDSPTARAIRHFMDASDAYLAHDAEKAQAGWEHARRAALAVGNEELARQAGYLRSLALRRLDAAEEAMGLVRLLLEQSRGDPLEPTLNYSLGSTLFTLDRFDEAQPVLEQAKRLAKRNGDSYVYAVAARQGCYVIHRQRVDDAIECYERLEADPELLLHRHILGTVLNAHASALEDSGQFTEAIGRFAEAIRVLGQAGSERSRVNALYNLANAQTQVGAYLQALGNHLQAFSYYRDTNRMRQVRLVSVAIANLYLHMGDPGQAEAWYEHALNSHQASSDHNRWVNFARIGLARLYLSLDRVDDAESMLSEVAPTPGSDLAVELGLAEVALASAKDTLDESLLAETCRAAEESGDSDQLGRCATWRASFAISQGQFDRATKVVHEALGRSPPADVSIELDFLAARAMLEMGRYASARSRATRVAEALFEVSAATPSWQVFNLGQAHDRIWGLALEAVLGDPALDRGRQAELLWTFDRMRRNLVERVFRREADLFSAPGLSLAELNGWSETLLGGGEIPVEVSERLLRIDASEVLKAGIAPAIDFDLPETPTISYWVGNERSVALVADESRARFAELPGRELLDSAINGTLQAIAGGSQLGWEQLEALIIEPIVDFMPDGGELNIVPDGLLAMVPFEVFAVNGESVLSRYAIAYSHGTSHSAGDLSWRGSANAALMVLAGPEYAGVRPSLDQAVGEVEVARRTFRSVRALTGPQATRSALLSPPESDVPNILHVAAHGRWDLESPAHSGLWMAEPNGFVSARELASSHWPTDLTVLTACSTNAGRLRDRSGPVQSVALAAMVAGAKNVLATSWDVSDTAAYAFSEAFYSELVAGQTVREATRNAKLAMRADPFWQAPKFWAAFQPWTR